MSSNMQKLGNTLAKRMQRTASQAVPVTVELGTINGDLSLTTDSLVGNIAPQDYMIDLQLTHETYYTYNELNSSANAPHVHEGAESQHTQAAGTGQHVHNSDGLHDHRVPSVFRRLKPGDRVLVMWVGHEPIITAIVVSGETITPN